MKLVLLMYLEGDEATVEGLLEEHRVVAFSRLEIEGHAGGVATGWYGRVAPYRSRLVFTLVDEETADRLLAAVAACDRCEDPRHPLRAIRLGVEESAVAGLPSHDASDRADRERPPGGRDRPPNEREKS